MANDSKQVLLVDSAESILPEYDQGTEYDQGIEVSPCCEAPVIDGFGLAGGGFGVYNYCDKCGKILTKTITDD